MTSNGLQHLLVDVADAVIGLAEAPGEAAAAIQNREQIAGLQHLPVEVRAGRAEQRGGGGRSADQRFGVVRRHDAAGERDIGDIGAKGVTERVERRRRAGQAEASSGRRRRQG